MKKTILIPIISLLLLVGSIYSCSTNPQAKDHTYKVQILNKYVQPTTYKGHTKYQDYYLICKKDSLKFDLKVTLVAYDEAKIGGYMWFDLNYLDLQIYDNTSDTISFIIGMIALICLLVYIISKIEV